MIDYYFLSTPLHLLMAANLSVQNPDHETVAVVMAKSPAAGARYRAITGRFPDLFGRTLDVSGPSPRQAFAALRAEFARRMAARIFTGNDRRIEFQYAMHVASPLNPDLEGIYLDEGAVTYFGHKSMDRFAHRHLDPLAKKLWYGRWYKPARTTGASGWIRTACVAFPDAVHPLLRSKRLVAVDPAPFHSPPLKRLAAAMIEGHPEYGELLRKIRVVVTLPHEGAYLRDPARYEAAARALLARVNPAQIAVKAHPRSTHRAMIEHMFPGTTALDPTVGMEALLPLLPGGCVVAGDISSTLLTTRWLRPDLPVAALRTREEPPPEMIRLFMMLDIPLLSAVELEPWLARVAAP